MLSILSMLSLKCCCKDLFPIQLSSALFSLAAKYGGMGLIVPPEICPKEYENFQEITKETTNKVMRNEIQFQDKLVSTAKIKSGIKNPKKEKLNDAKIQEVTNKICKTKLRSTEAFWLTVIPIKKNGFFLEKQAFWDAIRIKSDIPLERLPMFWWRLV